MKSRFLNASLTLMGLAFAAGCASSNKNGGREAYFIFKSDVVDYSDPKFGYRCSTNSIIANAISYKVDGPYGSEEDCENSGVLHRLRSAEAKRIDDELSKPPYKFFRADIAAGRVNKGMPREVVLKSLGEPDDTRKIETKYRNSEELRYSKQTVYLEGGVVVEVREK